jgi:hypothetical protein
VSTQKGFDVGRWLRSSAGAAVVWMRHEIGTTEIALALALVLLAAGFWSWWRPGAYLAPAIVLLWMFLPVRHRFVVATPEPRKRDQ